MYLTQEIGIGVQFIKELQNNTFVSLQLLPSKSSKNYLYEKHGFRADEKSINPINKQVNIRYHWRVD